MTPMRGTETVDHESAARSPWNSRADCACGWSS